MRPPPSGETFPEAEEEIDGGEEMDGDLFPQPGLIDNDSDGGPFPPIKGKGAPSDDTPNMLVPIEDDLAEVDPGPVTEDEPVAGITVQMTNGQGDHMQRDFDPAQIIMLMGLAMSTGKSIERVIAEVMFEEHFDDRDF